MTSGIIEILIENAGVQAAVGQDTLGQYKVYPVQAPQNVPTPYVVVAESALRPTLSKGDASELDYPKYDVLVYSTDFHQTELIQQACRNAIDNGAGFITDAGVTFDSIYMVDRKDLFQQAQGEGGGLYVKLGVYEAAAKR
jgi:hypothetical protein